MKLKIIFIIFYLFYQFLKSNILAFCRDLKSSDILRKALEKTIECKERTLHRRINFPKFLSIGCLDDVASVKQYNSKSNSWQMVHTMSITIKEFAVECVGNQFCYGFIERLYLCYWRIWILLGAGC